MAETVPTITVSMDKKCLRCKKGGSTESGFCMGCIGFFIKKNGFSGGSNPMEKVRRAMLAYARKARP